MILVLLLVTVSGAFAQDEGPMLFANYNIPINPPDPDELAAKDTEVPPAAAENLAVGLGYNFWGIFMVSGHMYNEILYGADSFLNIDAIRPIGVFSAGLGLEIPLGGVGVVLDWQRLFTGASSTAGIHTLSHAFKWGLSFEITPHFALEGYARRLSNFSSRAKEEYLTYDGDTKFSTFGIGTIIRFCGDCD
jgi:hypothetical protein